MVQIKPVAKSIKLNVGDQAPDFTLFTHNEGELNLAWYQTRSNVVLVFYPGDWTPVCGNHISIYERDFEEIDSRNTKILAISVDSIFCHRAWAKSMGGFSFPLMSDYFPHGEVSEKYGVLNKRGYANRFIFLIDKSGVIQYIEDVGNSVVPDNKQLLAEIDKLSQSK